MAWKYMQYNGETGKRRTVEGSGGGASSFSELEDVNFSDLQNGQVPKYNSTTQKWENADESGGSSTLAGLSDVALSSLSDGQILMYDAADDKWVNSRIGGLTKRWSGNIPANSYVDIDCSNYVSEGGTFIFVPQSTNHFGAVLVVLNEWATNVTSYSIGGVNVNNYSFSRPSAKHIRISMNDKYTRYAMLYQFT